VEHQLIFGKLFEFSYTNVNMTLNMSIRTGVFLCLLFSITNLCAQTQSLNAVYAGTEYVYNQSSDAGSVERTDFVYYFRPNGSFCSDLDKPGWQKRVSGTYSLTGNQVKMRWLNDGAERIILLSVTGETGQSGGATFIRMDIADKVPTGYFKYVRSSGKQDGLFFNDAGHYGHAISAVTVSGNAVSGNSTKYDEEGNYSIRQSELTLKTDKGQAETMSFFCNKNNNAIAVIDGRIYYRDEDNSKELTSPSSNMAKTASPAADKLDVGMNLLINANKTHGGKNLDNITTLKAVMTTNNLTLTVLADLKSQTVRLTSSLENNTILVEQLEGNDGWSYDGNGFSPLTPQRIVELKRYLCCGLLGLKSDILAKSTATLQTQQSELSSVMVLLGNIRAGYIINNRNDRLEALIMADANNATTTVTYTDYKKTANLLLPYTEIVQAGKHAQVISYKDYTINPAFTTNDWKKP